MLLTMMGLMKAEVADPNSKAFFAMSYNADRNNSFAFSKLLELSPDSVNVLVMLEHLRLVLAQNPLDLDSALRFADYARAIELYSTASEAYGYCSELHNYLYPNNPLPAEIYLPWAISDLNTPGRLQDCIKLAEKVRNSGRFDLVLDSIAARAAIKLGDQKQANLIFEQAEKKAIQQFNSDKSNPELAKRIAWFYCFAKQEPNQAAQYAAAAYALEPNSPMSSALYAYTLFEQKQKEPARKIAENLPTIKLHR